MNKLMLLSGRTRREGWKTLDAKGSVDYLAIVPPLPEEVRAVKWDEIELIHGINVLYPWEAERLLREIAEVMAPGGVLALEQPDLILTLQQGRGLESIYGDPTLEDPSHMCKWGYTPTSLVSLLHRCGFGTCSLRGALHHVRERDFRVEAIV